MTVRRVRGASLGVTGALVAGLLLAPGTGSAGASGAADPAFYRVGADSSAQATVTARVASGDRAAARAARGKGVKVSKQVQILQVYAGTNSVGNQGIAVAAGPRHVMQVAGTATRVLNKRTGAVVNTKQLGQLLSIAGSFDSVNQGTVVYDPLARRWFVAAITDDGGDVGLALRVSKGAKPTKWQPTVLFASAARADTNADVTESRPAIGTSSNKVAITTISDDPSAPGNVNRIFMFPKQPLMNGNAPSPWAADVNSTYDGQRPAVNASKQANIFIAVPDTGDATLTTYTGAAKGTPPNFSKNVVYPTRGTMTTPPVVDQGSGDDLDLGPLEFSGVSFRNGRVFAAASGDCSGAACIRLIGIGTSAGVTLIEDEKITAPTVGHEVFSPSVAIDSKGYVHLAATDVASGAGGPSLAVAVLTKVNLAQAAGGALKKRYVQQATAAFNDNGAAGTVDWYTSTAAAVDPTSPWDTWVTGAIGSSAVSSPNLQTAVARISMARSTVTLTANPVRVNRGAKTRLTVTVKRPKSQDTIAGQRVILQRRPASGGAWKQVGKGRTNASGVFSKRITVSRDVQFRGVLRKVQQSGGQGVGYDRVNSRPVTVRLR